MAGEVDLGGVFASTGTLTASLTSVDAPRVELGVVLSGSSSFVVTELVVTPPGPIDLNVAVDGTSYLYGRLSTEQPIYDGFINLTDRAPLAYSILPSLIPPRVTVDRPAIGWLGPPLVEYHDDRSSSVVTVPTVGTSWTVVSGGTVLAVNGNPVRRSTEDEIFDGVYEP